MRWLRDIVLVIMIATLCAGGGWWWLDRHAQADLTDRTLADRHRLEMEVRYRAATKKADLNSRGWPHTVDPKWFEDQPPQNRLVDNLRPWIEVAPVEQAELTHPPIRITINDQLAAFWYNPYQGLVRARVPIQVSDDSATALYNQVNGTDLASIHWDEAAAIARSRPKNTAAAPTHGHASSDGTHAAHDHNAHAITPPKRD